MAAGEKKMDGEITTTITTTIADGATKIIMDGETKVEIKEETKEETKEEVCGAIHSMDPSGSMKCKSIKETFLLSKLTISKSLSRIKSS